MSRLSDILGSEDRGALARNLATRAVSAIRGAGLKPVVVSSASDTRTWASREDLEVWPDPGNGLSAAASSAIARLDDEKWIVLLPDLPLVSSTAIQDIAELAESRTVLVPSLDGGTNIIASHGSFPFRYGPASFHRHLAARPSALVVSRPELSIDIDTPSHLLYFPELMNPPTLPS